MDFKFSPMTTAIDNTDKSFDSSLSSITMHKRVYPIINISQTFNIKFNNPIIPESIQSSYFNISDIEKEEVFYEVGIIDNGKGIMILKQVSNNLILNSNIGTVNYDTGEISITIFPYGIPLDTLDIRVYATPKYKNIVSGYNQIIIPDDSAINVDVNRMQGVTVTMNVIDNT